jgi:hypothetical protein
MSGGGPPGPPPGDPDDPDDPAGQDQAVLLYLAALESRRSTPGTLPHPDDAAAALASAAMVTSDDSRDLEAQLGASAPGSDANVAELEQRFLLVAAAYGERHGVTYNGWISAGVDPHVLARAGIRVPPGD